MTIIVEEYSSAARCGQCEVTLWTTDLIVPVLCKCGTTMLYPHDVTTISEAELEVAVREEYGLLSDDTVLLVKI